MVIYTFRHRQALEFLVQKGHLWMHNGKFEWKFPGWNLAYSFGKNWVWMSRKICCRTSSGVFSMAVSWNQEQNHWCFLNIFSCIRKNSRWVHRERKTLMVMARFKIGFCGKFLLIAFHDTLILSRNLVKKQKGSVFGKKCFFNWKTVLLGF